MDYKYDVFISYSRKDYSDGNIIIPNNAISAIMDVFRKNEITFWFDEEGIYSGQEYKNIIIDAIHSSKIFLFVSSSHSNESRWTISEIFEAFEANKYIIPFKIEDCDFHTKIRFELRPLDFILYCGNEENALQELVRSVINYKEELAAKQRKEAENVRIEDIKRKIKETAEDFNIQAIKQDALRRDIMSLYRTIDVVQKPCPVCGRLVNIEDTYCERCGWTFPAMPSFAEDKIALNQGLLTTVKTNWKIINQVTDAKVKVISLENENNSLKRQLESLTDDCKKFQDMLSLLEQSNNKLKTEISSFQKTVSDKENEISALTLENQELQELLKTKTEECEQSIEKINDMQRQADLEKMKKTLKSKTQIYHEIIPRAQTASASYLFPTDYIGRVNLYKIISILKDEYNLDFTQNSFRNCNTISDLIDVVAKKANLVE